MEQRRQMRKTGASEVLLEVQMKEKVTREFFQQDWSLILSKFQLKADDDPRLVGLLPMIKDEGLLEAQLRRLLASRHLALKEERWLQENLPWPPDNIASIPNAYRRGPDFLRNEGLSGHIQYAAVNGLSLGQRSRRLENDVRSEGIAFALLPVFSKLSHLDSSQEKELNKKLQDERTGFWKWNPSIIYHERKYVRPSNAIPHRYSGVSYPEEYAAFRRGYVASKGASQDE
ncbi:hypothetical protein TSTA_060150 [Talaromyces stipitatus ATCC 10500]|uniref:Uncharacterized protein n=1 Tax=Talaromyces stipitatus (strain ATCC 10500 / CBS 375.48 / QM 6759 / NRRL 1006) TaxID=441959 RepID=B8LU45_TALSN|nr:uncharacterized protein TSTA_060150 [Talaromyces stipitatus ATCC 10500]EED22517.1 hypothetical protein TSTA_060150 [Talaromyces stipitatus ATCC 10500]